jgi:3-oxoacyl-[acyl-carrier-protein] synthase II
MASRVVISGIGAVSPIGHNGEGFWKACLAGRSGVRRLESAWVTETGLSSQIAATVEGYSAESAGLDRKQARVLDRTSVFAVGAAGDALIDAGFELEKDPHRRGQLVIEGVDATRVATIVGSGMGGITTLEISHALWRETRSKTSVKRFSLPMLIPNAPAGQVAIRYGAKGECKAIATACAAGTMALGDGYRLIRAGEADLVIAGGAEGAAADDDAYGLLGFERLHTLSTRNDQPKRASRPFDRERDGFVLGEGGAILILEREDHAVARGARVYAVVEGYAANCDARSMMQLDETGEMICALIESALRSAGCSADEVDYVSAHGTATLVNDRTEARALRNYFGARCDRIPVTALKSMTGHCIAASGPMETAAAARSLAEGILAPTINYQYPDPECDVDVVANEPRRQQAGLCVKLSYGFGGHNACLVLSRP